MKFDVVSIFPEFFTSPLSCGLLRIAQEKGLIEISITNPRNFTQDGIVDDYQFGGGAGMLMKPEPITKAINHVKTKNSCLIHLTPKGRRLDQNIIKELAKNEHTIIICGRYKGIDERINHIFKPLEISVGDYVLSGGEIAALVVIESITRLLPGALGNRDSADSDSFQEYLLESPRYTRPHIFKKFVIPQILRSGNHSLVGLWRRKNSLEKTLRQRPDLLPLGTYSKSDFEILLGVLDGKNSRN